jgi:hypothetical protein
MSLTNKQIYDLNNMNVAAQNVQLGNMLNDMTNVGTKDFYVVSPYDADKPNLQEMIEKYKNREFPILYSEGSPMVCPLMQCSPVLSMQATDSFIMGLQWTGVINLTGETTSPFVIQTVTCTNNTLVPDETTGITPEYDANEDRWGGFIHQVTTTPV